MTSKSVKDILKLFQDVGDRDHDTGDSVPAQHAYHGNYGGAISTCGIRCGI